MNKLYYSIIIVTLIEDHVVQKIDIWMNNSSQYLNATTSFEKRVNGNIKLQLNYGWCFEE